MNQLESGKINDPLAEMHFPAKLMEVLMPFVQAGLAFHTLYEAPFEYPFNFLKYTQACPDGEQLPADAIPIYFYEEGKEVFDSSWNKTSIAVHSHAKGTRKTYCGVPYEWVPTNP